MSEINKRNCLREAIPFVMCYTFILSAILAIKIYFEQLSLAEFISRKVPRNWSKRVILSCFISPSLHSISRHGRFSI